MQIEAQTVTAAVIMPLPYNLFKCCNNVLSDTATALGPTGIQNVLACASTISAFIHI